MKDQSIKCAKQENELFFKLCFREKGNTASSMKPLFPWDYVETKEENRPSSYDGWIFLLMSVFVASREKKMCVLKQQFYTCKNSLLYI